MHTIDRRGLLARAAAGAGLVALAGPAAQPAAAAELDLTNVRLVCSSKRLAITWYTRWINAGAAVRPDATTRALVLELRKQEQAHYALLAPLLNGTAPSDDDFDYALPAGALRTAAAATGFSLDLENLVLGIAIAASATTQDSTISEPLARVAAGDAQHVSALSSLAGGSPIPSGLARPIGLEDASNQLDQFLS